MRGMTKLHWTSKELKTLNEGYSKLNKNNLCTLLGSRTIDAITKKAARLSLISYWKLENPYHNGPSLISLSSSAKKPLETSLAWLAGIIDGEGCLCIHKPSKRRSQRSTEAALVISTTSLEMMEKVQKIISEIVGRRIPLRSRKKQREDWQDQWVVSLSARLELFWILTYILPYLTTKRVKANLMLNWLGEVMKQDDPGRRRLIHSEYYHALKEAK